MEHTHPYTTPTPNIKLPHQPRLVDRISLFLVHCSSEFFSCHYQISRLSISKPLLVLNVVQLFHCTKRFDLLLKVCCPVLRISSITPCTLKVVKEFDQTIIIDLIVRINSLSYWHGLAPVQHGIKGCYHDCT